MNRSFFGEVFQEGLANLALDVSRFFLRICCARGVLQDLFEFLLCAVPTEVHEAKYHAPMVVDVTTLGLNHRAVQMNGFAGPGVFYLQGKHRPFGGGQFGIKVTTFS